MRAVTIAVASLLGALLALAICIHGKTTIIILTSGPRFDPGGDGRTLFSLFFIWPAIVIASPFVGAVTAGVSAHLLLKKPDR